MTTPTVVQKFIKPASILILRLVALVAVYKICNIYDWKNLGQMLTLKSTSIVVGVIMLYGLKLLIDALRSKRLSMAFRVPISFAQLFKFNLQSVAFDFVLPIPQAEEVYRFGRFTAYSDKKTALLLAVCIRATGLVATVISLTITIVLTSLKLRPLFAGINVFWIYFFVFDLSAATVLGFFYLRRKHRKDPTFADRFIQRLKLVKQAFRDHRYHLLEGVALSFISQLTYAASIFLICLCTGAGITFFKVYLIVPLIYFGGMVPVGMAGLGIKEAVIAWSLQQFGVLRLVAINIALFHLVVMIFYLLLGAILLLIERKKNVVGITG